MSSSSDSDSDNEELNELREPRSWDDVADTINDEEPDDAGDLYFTGRSAEGGGTVTSPSIFDEPGKFRDPLGILRGPPKGVKKVPDVEEEGFDPVKVLSQLHSQTRYDELVAGARRLTRKLSSQEEDIKQLVRDNFERFVSCKDVIDNLYTVIVENEISTQGTGTVKLEHTYAEIVARAQRVYGPLLVRQDESEKIRQALSVLQRFSFLFSLPSKISANIKSGDYDKAVQHYKKATALAEDSKVGLFRKVMGEVETIITEFRTMLYTSLAEPNASFESQVKIIRLLVELGRKSTDKDQEDPGWYYLQNTASRLIVLLNESKSVRVMCTIVTRQIPNLWKMGSHYLGGKFDADSKQRAKAQAHPELNSKRAKESKDSGKSAPIRVYYVNETFASLRVDPTKTAKDIIDQCMRRLPIEETEMYTDTDFAVYTWIEKRKREGTMIKVTELPSDEKLYKIHKKWGDNKSGNTHKFLFKRKDVKFPKIVDSRDKVIIKSLNDAVKDKVEKDGILEKRGKVRSEPEFYSLVNSILQVFSTRVTEMLFADALDPDIPEIEEGTDPELPPDNLTPTTDQEWVFATMREDVTFVVSTQAAIQRAGVRDKPLVTIADLSLNICRNYVNRVCSQWAAEVSLLYLSAHKEHIKDGADTTVQLFSVTQLPNQFAATSRFYLSQLSGLNINGRNHPLHHQILSSFSEIIKCFGDCLHHLSFTNQKNIRLSNSGFGFVSQITVNDIRRPATDYSTSASSGLSLNDNSVVNKTDELALTRDGWMIAGLAHSEFTRTQIIPSLWMYFLEEFKLGTADTRPDEEVMAAVDVIQLLGGMLLERYIHSKTLRLNYIVQKGLQLSGIDWGLTVPPVAVSEYVMAMLLYFVYVHSEVVSVSGNIANITSKVITPMITNAALAIHRAVSQLEGFSVWGLWQIRLDLAFFECILSRYVSRDTDIVSRNIRDLLDKYEEEGGLAPDDEGYEPRKINDDMSAIVDETVKSASISFSCLLEKT